MTDYTDNFGFGTSLFDSAQSRSELGQADSRHEQCYTVSGLNKYLNGLLKSNPMLQDLQVSGEVSNFRPHYSGHLYFTLKDSASSLRCVMFRSAASRVPFKLENGLSVVARGSVSIYERDGQYQLYCEEIHAAGVGDLYTAYEQMKKKLSDEGLFDQSRKRALPPLPGSVCVVTSPTGSVIRDIINVSVRRFPNAVIKLYPVQVQGSAAAPQITHAIEKINSLGLADVIIIARGGGSLEDLWAFNEEAVARAIAASAIPVVSAVGHETDTTISDFTADLRAPTPSAAAEIVFPEAAALASRVSQYKKQLSASLRKKCDRAKRRLERCAASHAFAKPTHRVEMCRMRLNGAEEKLTSAMRAVADRGGERLAVLSAKLDALSPLSTLARGYSVVTALPHGKTVSDSGEVETGQRVNVLLKKGSLLCEVLDRFS